MFSKTNTRGLVIREPQASAYTGSRGKDTNNKLMIYLKRGFIMLGC
jgi:hypothetical protein